MLDHPKQHPCRRIENTPCREFCLTRYTWRRSTWRSTLHDYLQHFVSCNSHWQDEDGSVMRYCIKAGNKALSYPRIPNLLLMNAPERRRLCSADLMARKVLAAAFRRLERRFAENDHHCHSTLQPARRIPTSHSSTSGQKMRHLFVAGLAICVSSSLAMAQDRNACVARAKYQRDQCFRQAQGDNVASRACTSQYISNLQYCQSSSAGPLHPIQPRIRPAQPRSKPIKPRIKLKPVKPQIRPVQPLIGR
jgi:hypothetical protein